MRFAVTKVWQKNKKRDGICENVVTLRYKRKSGAQTARNTNVTGGLHRLSVLIHSDKGFIID